MKPFYCRVGNKQSISKKIINLFPVHLTYVEPFVGSGAILFNKEPSEKEIINDLDKNVVEGFRLLKNAPSSDTFMIRRTLKEQQQLVETNPTSIQDKILKKLYQSCNTFGGTGKGKLYKSYNQSKKINKIDEYKNRLKNVKIFNNDYKNIIKKYDTPTTLFFLDPPYEQSNNLYSHSSFDFEELRDILTNIKGYFILTLNDSSNIRRIFKDFVIKGITVNKNKNPSSKQPIGGTRQEVIIMNYR